MLVMALCGHWISDFLTRHDVPQIWNVLGSITSALLLYYLLFLLTDTVNRSHRRDRLRLWRTN